VVTSAPGKLVLLGEYAVLFGHPAVVLAVNRRARVDLCAAASDDWSVAAPGFEESRSGFTLDGTRGFRWREPASDAAGKFVFVEKVIGSLVTAEVLDPEGLPPASITLDTREFFQPSASGVAKLGLGSSAALTVALTEALRHWSDQDDRQPTVDLARLLDLHRTFQGGRGSGIDLAASVTGGVVEYELTDGGRNPKAQSLRLPEDLHLVFLWTGRSASTGDFLARLEEGMSNDGGEIAAVLNQLGSLSAAGIADLCDGRISVLLDHVSQFGRVMEQLGHATGIPILSGEHLELRRLADDVGVSYKPSGAGGGDVGIGFTDDPDRAKAFAAKAADAGFPPLNLEVDPNGVQADY
jgi:phosphomevalonate kinase